MPNYTDEDIRKMRADYNLNRAAKRAAYLAFQEELDESRSTPSNYSPVVVKPRPQWVEPLLWMLAMVVVVGMLWTINWLCH